MSKYSVSAKLQRFLQKAELIAYLFESMTFSL